MENKFNLKDEVYLVVGDKNNKKTVINDTIEEVEIYEDAVWYRLGYYDIWIEEKYCYATREAAKDRLFKLEKGEKTDDEDIY